MAIIQNDAFIGVLGDELIHPMKGISVKPKDVLSNKVVLLYFSAHWCAPCRKFTSMLVEFYTKLKETNHDFEIVFCSFDHFKAEYNKYSSTMPWYSLPFNFAGRHHLVKHYKAEGIPHLVVVDCNGRTLSLDGVSMVQIDFEGYEFPWRPKALRDFFPPTILTKAEKLSMMTICDKYIMLYFSAQWCPPCREFTPTVCKAYSELLQRRSDFELIYVSSDRDEESFSSCYEQMPFCAIPFRDVAERAGLANRFEIRGIPTLLMLGPENEDGERQVINQDVREFIQQEEWGQFPFFPTTYGDLSHAGDDINEKKCLIVFHENGDDEAQQEAVKVIKETASRYSDLGMRFLWALDAAGLVMRVRAAIGVSSVDDEPTIVILDVPDRGGYYLSKNKEVSVENIVNFIDAPGVRYQINK